MPKTINIEVSDRGFVVMDDMVALLQSLPKVQQVIICQHLLDLVDMSRGDKAYIDKILANWLYGNVATSKQPAP